MTKREMMIKAHKMAKQMIGNYSARIALALRQLWASVKAGVKKVAREYKMVAIKAYDGFNGRRYSNPWVALITRDNKWVFKGVGGYTGAYGAGDAGELYVAAPVNGQVYAYGQKDYRKPNEKNYEYVQFYNGEFLPVAKTELLRALQDIKEDK